MDKLSYNRRNITTSQPKDMRAWSQLNFSLTASGNSCYSITILQCKQIYQQFFLLKFMNIDEDFERSAALENYCQTVEF